MVAPRRATAGAGMVPSTGLVGVPLSVGQPPPRSGSFRAAHPAAQPASQARRYCARGLVVDGTTHAVAREVAELAARLTEPRVARGLEPGRPRRVRFGHQPGELEARQVMAGIARRTVCGIGARVAGLVARAVVAAVARRTQRCLFARVLRAAHLADLGLGLVELAHARLERRLAARGPHPHGEAVVEHPREHHTRVVDAVRTRALEQLRRQLVIAPKPEHRQIRQVETRIGILGLAPPPQQRQRSLKPRCRLGVALLAPEISPEIRSAEGGARRTVARLARAFVLGQRRLRIVRHAHRVRMGGGQLETPPRVAALARLVERRRGRLVVARRAVAVSRCEPRSQMSGSIGAGRWRCRRRGRFGGRLGRAASNDAENE